ncbi:unnamed protein product [Brassicogethes aeneus]|uniref:Uncharacterized protein n=1 Tax=Brassicogethes aeneus TaxID=1431903 RepID=A0A9P0BGP8_BRAAE|nr:unnamed protein product [Brassicogethes aeneus]
MDKDEEKLDKVHKAIQKGNILDSGKVTKYGNKRETEAIHIRGNTTKDMATQTQTTEAISTKNREVEVCDIEDCNNFSNWEQKACRDWTDTVFTNTTCKEGNPLETKDQAMKVVWIGPNDKQMEKGTQKSYKFPELLTDIMEDFGILEMESKIKTAKFGQTTKRKIAKITHKENEEDIYGKLVILKNRMRRRRKYRSTQTGKNATRKIQKNDGSNIPRLHDTMIYIKEGDKEEINPKQTTEA